MLVVRVRTPLSVDHVAVLVGAGRQLEDLGPDTAVPIGLDARAHALVRHPAVEVARDAHVVRVGIAEPHHHLPRCRTLSLPRGLGLRLRGRTRLDLDRQSPLRNLGLDEVNFARAVDRLMEQAGAEANAATWTDWTYYYENAPRDALPLLIELEADRMSNLVLRTPQVSSEKEVVANENSDSDLRCRTMIRMEA